MNNKNKDILSGILVILILIAVVVLVGVSYAAWTMNAKQTNTNVVSTGCFETSSDLGTSSENEAINLVDAMPINDSEAMTTSGFTFTITNVCKTYATYQVNLETLSTSTLDISYLTAVLNNNTPKKLSNYQSVNKYLDAAISSNKLISGGLAQNESVTYTLRLWIGDDIEYTPAISNKTYSGKIVVKSLELVDELATNKIQNLVAGASSSSTDEITVDIENDGSCTNSLAYDGTTDNNLRYVGKNPCNYVCFNNECPSQSEVYMMYADGDISTGAPRFNGGNNFDTEEACQQSALNGNVQSLGTAAFTCTLDNSTNKYYVEAHGYLDNYTYLTAEECETGLSSNGLKSSSTPSGLSCRTNTVTTGGWRIIGLINNVDNGTGKKEQRIKLIRNESLGDYSWDLSAKTVNNGYGINQWGATDTYDGADLMRELNTDYLNPNLTSNPMWYGYQSGYTDSNYTSGYGQNTEFDKSKTLSISAQELIGDAVWYTGTYNDTAPNNSFVTTPVAYQNERSNNPASTNSGKYCSSGTYCNDTIARTYSWTGKAALMNVSDYGYAVGGSVRSTCLTTNLSSYNSNSCYTNDWLHNGTHQWTLSPYASSYACKAGLVHYIGDIPSIPSSTYIVKDVYSVRPSIYLLPNVKITGGNGSGSNPYTLGID